MALDFGLLSQVPSFGQQFMAGQQAAQAQQERNMLRQQQMQQMEYQRRNMLAQEQERQAIAAERQRATQQQNALSEYVRSGMPQGTAGLAQFGETGLKTAKALREERVGALDEERKKLEYVTQRLASATPETYGAIRSDLGRISPEFVRALPTEYNAEHIGGLVRQGLALKDQLDLYKPMTVAPGASVFNPRTGQPMYTAPAAPEKGYEPPELEKLQNALSALPQGDPRRAAYESRIRMLTTREPKEPREPSAPIAVVDDATGRVKYVSREEAMGKTPAAAMEGLAPKEIQKREAALPQATSAIKGFEAKSDAFIKDLKALRNDPGLENITGMIYGRTGSLSAAGSRAQALYDKVTAKGGFQALQDLRDASKTGGALGNVSNQEGRQLTASFAAIDRRQSAADVRAAIDQAIADIEGSKTRMREAYDATYSYKQQGAAPAAPAVTRSGATVSNW